MKLPKPTRMKVDKIKPYENNPRVISPKSVEAVKASIDRYGYVQPIVVDRNHVIIAGHTRHMAMQELGMESAEVYVVDMPEEKARAYRVVDNKTGERSEEHTSELQSRFDLVCRLLLEKKTQECITQRAPTRQLFASLVAVANE